jgi:hypothetical protein
MDGVVVLTRYELDHITTETDASLDFVMGVCIVIDRNINAAVF